MEPYSDNRDPSGRIVLSYNATGYFYGYDVTNVCAVQWVAWIDKSPSEPFYTYDAPFEFQYQFDTAGALVDIVGIPYECDSYNERDDLSAEFYFSVGYD